MENLDIPGYVVASKVCSYWRTRANKVLQRHVTATLQDGGIMLRAKGSSSLDKLYPLYFISSELQDQLKDADWATDRSEKLKRLVQESPQHTQELFSNIQVVDHEAINAKWDNVVNELLAYLQALGHSITSRQDARDSVGPGDCIECVGNTQVLFLMHPAPYVELLGVETMVLNIHCASPAESPLSADRGAEIPEWEPCMVGPHVPEFLVVIFKNDRPDCKLQRAEEGQYGHNLHSYLEDWVNYNEGLRVVLVGLDDFFGSETEYELFKHSFQSLATATPDLRWELLTREEYRLRVGSETYELHTEP